MAKTAEIEALVSELYTDLSDIKVRLSQGKELDQKKLSQLQKKVKIIDEHNITTINKQIPDLNSFELGRQYFSAAKDFSNLAQNGKDLKKPQDFSENMAANVEQYMQAIAILRMIYKKLDAIDESGGLF